MRRDQLRVGLGRALLELALGVMLATAATDAERGTAIGLAFIAGLLVFSTRVRWASRRRAFLAAHVALGGVAIASAVGTLAPSIRIPVVAVALGAGLELLHLDLVERRRIQEAVDTLRWPRSVFLRRIGSVIVVAAGARAMVSLEAHAQLASRHGVVALLAACAAFASLSAGFAAGPGRPRARPIDAVLFLGLGSVAALVRTG